MENEVDIEEKRMNIDDYGLTDREAIFVTNYVQTFNGARSAIKAGYSPKGAYSASKSMLGRDHVKLAIQGYIQQSHLDAQKILSVLGEIASADIGSLFSVTRSLNGEEPDELVLDLDMVLEKGHLIKSITPTKHGYRLEMYDKMKALQLLGTHLQLFTNKESIDWDNKRLPDGRSAEDLKAELRKYLLEGGDTP